MERIVLCWSGGKDSALALWALRHEQHELHVRQLVRRQR